MDDAGEMPLPPYITARDAPDERYQTVYAVRPIRRRARPRASTSRRASRRAGAAGVERATVTLHVGLDTFQPLEGTTVDEHRIHREWYACRQDLTGHRRDQGRRRRVVAVGTTTDPVLETLARTGEGQGWTDLYIVPPQPIRSADALITNFHLPRSSLLLLVTAFVQDGMQTSRSRRATRCWPPIGPRWRAASGTTFGDAMLIA